MSDGKAEAAIFFRCPQQMRKALEDAARRDDRSVSYVIRKLLADAIRSTPKSSQTEARANG